MSGFGPVGSAGGGDGASGAAGGDLTGTYPNPTFSTSVVTAAAKTVLDDSTIAAMVNTLGGASSSGTGGLARVSSPVFTTPNIGSATGSISGNAATVTTNANLTGDVTSVGNAATLATSQPGAHTWAAAQTLQAGLTYTGATGINVVTIPDNLANAYAVQSTDGLNYMRVVSTNSGEMIVFGSDAPDGNSALPNNTIILRGAQYVAGGSATNQNSTLYIDSVGSKGSGQSSIQLRTPTRGSSGTTLNTTWAVRAEFYETSVDIKTALSIIGALTGVTTLSSTYITSSSSQTIIGANAVDNTSNTTGSVIRGATYVGGAGTSNQNGYLYIDSIGSKGSGQSAVGIRTPTKGSSGTTLNTTYAQRAQFYEGACDFLAPIVYTVTVTANTSSPVAVTAPDTVSANNSGSIFTNSGAGATQITYNIPAATVGRQYSFAVEDSGGIVIDPNGTDVVRVGASVSTNGGTVTSTTVGSYITIQCHKAGTWIASASTGTWTTS